MNATAPRSVPRSTFPADRRLWLGWILTALVGFGAGGPAGVALGVPGWIIENGYLSITLSTVGTCLLQWLVLRRQISRTGWWAPSSAMAAALSGAVIFGGLAIGGRIVVDVAWILGAGLLPLGTAFLQWRLVLRRHLIRGAYRWPLANLLGWVGGGMVGGAVGAIFDLPDKRDGIPSVVVWAVFGAIYGAITGTILLKLIRDKESAR